MGLPSSPQFQSVCRQYAEIEWHIENSKRTQSNALSATSSMQQLLHAQVAEAPSSQIFKVVHTPNIRQFPLWPTFLLPCSDLLLIPLQRRPGGTLTAPFQLPQNAKPARHGSRSIRCATRHAVHNPVSYPRPSGPCFSPRSIFCRSSALSRGLRPAPLSASRGPRRPPVAAPSGSPTADGLRLAAPPRTDGLPSSATAPPASAAAPVPENLAALPLDFRCTDNITRSREGHYIMQHSTQD